MNVYAKHIRQTLNLTKSDLAWIKEGFDPCEYCPKYRECSSPLKELDDNNVKKKQKCPETETNFNNQYEILPS